MEEDPLAGHPVLRTIRVLGRSASNVVVLASNTATGQLVAVKLIPRGFDSRQAKYLLRELLNHYELTLAKHPHVVSLLDCFLASRHLAIVMEYVDGENLQVFMEKAGGCVIEPLARFLFQQLVIALDFCHRRSKVNRNIRPSGLLLQLSDSALPLLKMADFSVSKDTLRNSEPRSQVGTAMYCAPEVLQNFVGVSYDAAAADMWSVGVVLFMMLCGRHPFSRPEDSVLTAQQQVIAMFKRVTAPPGSYDGDLFIPHVLPTSVLPGAQPGAPLSLAAADLLRGLLSRDPKTRMTLAAVQLHEWFRTGLPEGAALLNEVVAAEQEAAGAAAAMPTAVAAQLERMVIQAAAGPALPGMPSKELPGRYGSGGAGGGGGSGGGGLPPPRQELSYDAVMGPDSSSAPQQQHPPPQVPLVYRTVTTIGTSDAALSSVSIGSTVAGSAPTPLAEPGTALEPGLAAAAVAAAAAASNGAPAGDAAAGRGPGGLLVSPQWSPMGSTSGADGSCRVGGGGGGGQAAAAAAGCEGSDLLADLEAMVMGLPDDDILTAASLDFIMAASSQQLPQQQPQGPAAPGDASASPQPPLHQHPQQGTSSSFLPGDRSAPASTDNTTRSTLPSPAHPSPPPALPVAAYSSPQANGGGGAPPRPSDVGVHAVPQALYELPTGLGHPQVPQARDSPHQPAGRPSPPNVPSPLQLFASLHSVAAAAGDVAAGLLMRLNTESLPSPSTLAVVDAQPFLATTLPGCTDRRNSSMATIPSTYSIDWCTLSARSQALLSPQLGPMGSLLGMAMGSEGSGRGDAGGGQTSLAQSSLWHRICNEARGTLSGATSEAKELGRMAAAGLGGRR